MRRFILGNVERLQKWKHYFRGGSGVRHGFVMGWLLLMTSACNTQSQATLTALNVVDANSLCTVSPSTTTASSFFVLLSAGLLTGLSHCVGMCGPLVSAFSMRRRAERQEVSSPLVLFQMGRLTTYVVLGAALGGSGQLLAAAIRDWQDVFAVALGLLMALFGLSLLGLLPLQRWLSAIPVARFAGKWMRELTLSAHPAAPFGLGLANGLLPCGPLYAMALLAAVGGDPLRGASIMLIFGLGTLPAMLGLGFSASLLSLRLRGYLFRVAAILVVIVGLQLALRGLALSGQVAHTAIGGVMLW